MTALPPSPTLTQLHLLNLIAQHIDANGYGPSVRELTEAMSYRSTNATHDALDALEWKGCIKRAERVARSTRITLLGHRFLEGYRAGRAAEAEAERVRAVSPECADEFTTTPHLENPNP